VVGPDRSSPEEHTVEGDTYHARKVGIGGWAHLRYQHRPRTCGRPTPARSPR
jgi:hypothetical protein